MSQINLTIVRSRWVRGGRNGPSRMLNGRGNMCCLGFLALACGYYGYELDDLSDPRPVRDESGRDLFPPGTFRGDGGLSSNTEGLITANDDPDPTVDEPGGRRELRIAELMAGLGVAVTFVD